MCEDLYFHEFSLLGENMENSEKMMGAKAAVERAVAVLTVR